MDYMRKKINNIKLSIKIMLIISLTSLAILIGEFGARLIVYKAYDEQVYIRTAQLLTSYVDRVETEFDKIDSLMLTIIGDASMQNNLIKLRSKDLESWLSVARNVKTQLSSYRRLVNCCDMLTIRLPSGELLWEFKTLTEDEIQNFSQIAREANGSMVYIPGNECVWIVRQIRRIENSNMEELGTIIFKLNLDELISDMNQKYKDIDSDFVPWIAIYDNENCVYSSPNADINIENIKSKKNEWIIEDDNFIVGIYSNDLKWTFCVSIPYEKINHAINHANYRSVIITIAVAVISIFVCGFAMYRVVKHIELLLSKYHNFRKGILPDKDLLERYKERKDEIGELHNQFDRMAIDYKRITDEHYENMVLLKEAQFNQLQGQIRPHFLFNVLSTIIWTAYDNHDEKTAKMAEALGQILRSSVNENKKVATIKEEMELVEAYLYIQEVRYAGRFSVEVDIPESIYDIEIPIFTLQPIVENIIIHVVERSLEHCFIKISGEIVNDDIKVSIQDSGNLLQENTLEKLKSGELHAKGNGIGLNNVNRRIQLMFSERYGLQLLRDNGFSCVIIRLPQNKKHSDL